MFPLVGIYPPPPEENADKTSLTTLKCNVLPAPSYKRPPLLQMKEERGFNRPGNPMDTAPLVALLLTAAAVIV